MKLILFILLTLFSQLVFGQTTLKTVKHNTVRVLFEDKTGTHGLVYFHNETGNHKYNTLVNVLT